MELRVALPRISLIGRVAETPDTRTGTPNKMMPSRNRLGAVAVLLAALIAAGCRSQPTAEGSFDKTFEVTGPVRIELTNGSGDSRVTAGPAGEVRIHGEIQVRAWSDKSGQRRGAGWQRTAPWGRGGSLGGMGGAGSATK